MTAPQNIVSGGGLTVLGVIAILLGILFTAYEGNEWMRQVVLERMTPSDLVLPQAECPEDELEEEGLTVAECEQLVEDVTSYIVSKPGWFAGVQAWLAALGTLFAIASVVAGALLANFRQCGARLGAIAFGALAAVDFGHFVAVQQAGPILRAIHLPDAMLWFAVHFAFAIGFAFVHRSMRGGVDLSTGDSAVKAYGRFEVSTHWFTAVSIFFLFVSSWWMLALPLPSEDFRYREFPFQLHKNLGITIVLLLAAMALIRITRRKADDSEVAETASMRALRTYGHVGLYLLVFAVCVTGYLSSSYSGWGTEFWWLFELPYWGREDEELNQLFSDMHLWTCWLLLLAMALHIGAALLHAFRNDGMVRRILRW